MSKFLKVGCFTIVILILLGLVFTVGIGVGAVGGAADKFSVPKLHKTAIGGSGGNEIAFVSLDGVILTSPTEDPLALAGGVITPQVVGNTLKLILDDEAIKGVVLSINSPGGSAVASDQIYQFVKNTAAQKPVVMLMEDIAASGGYFVASAGSFIFANPATMTGSIGVIAEITDIQELFKKIGLKQEVYKTGEFKDLFSATRTRTPAEQKMIRELLDSAYGLFVNRVAEGRKMEVAKVFDLAQGQVFSGLKAKELGLIDELGYRRDAFEKAKELAGIKEAQFVEVTTRSFWQQLFSEARSQNPLSALIPYLSLRPSGALFLHK